MVRRDTLERELRFCLETIPYASLQERIYLIMSYIISLLWILKTLGVSAFFN